MSRMEIDLNPWITPNYVLGKVPPRLRQDGFIDPPKWALSEVEPHILSDLCDEFRRGVFEKAGKPDPKVKGQACWQQDPERYP